MPMHHRHKRIVNLQEEQDRIYAHAVPCIMIILAVIAAVVFHGFNHHTDAQPLHDPPALESPLQ